MAFARLVRLRRHVPGRVVLALLAASLAFPSAAAASALASRPAAAATAAPVVRVVGNELVNAQGQPMRLVGVNRSGTEYACVQGWGIFDGPSGGASVAAIASWHADAVRVPLNEDCWLGINGVDPAYSGSNYRSAVEAYVSRLNAAGLVAVLDLHWSAPGGQPATGQQMMADADHSPAFWSSVASTFRTDPGVAFDLYNEPHGISWSCWLAGCTTPAGWRAAGMQSLLDAVRSMGATQPVLAEGLNWGGDLSGWLAHEPQDPLHQLVASAHIYDYSQCNTTSCWNSTIAPVAAVVPVVTGELGETDCGASFVDSYMGWADAHGVSYLAWAWSTASCAGEPALISSYSGTPTAFGAGVRNHLAALAAISPLFAPAAGPPGPAPDPLAGWGVEWGATTASVSSSPGGLSVDLSGTGYPGISSGSAPAGLAPGQVVTYRIDNPTGAPLQIVPFAQDSAWTVHFAPAVALAPGWSTVTWMAPPENGLTEIGFQVNDSTSFTGAVLVASAAW